MILRILLVLLLIALSLKLYNDLHLDFLDDILPDWILGSSKVVSEGLDTAWEKTVTSPWVENHLKAARRLGHEISIKQQEATREKRALRAKKNALKRKILELGDEEIDSLIEKLPITKEAPQALLQVQRKGVQPAASRSNVRLQQEISATQPQAQPVVVESASKWQKVLPEEPTIPAALQSAVQLQQDQNIDQPQQVHSAAVQPAVTQSVIQLQQELPAAPSLDQQKETTQPVAVSVIQLQQVPAEQAEETAHQPATLPVSQSQQNKGNTVNLNAAVQPAQQLPSDDQTQESNQPTVVKSIVHLQEIPEASPKESPQEVPAPSNAVPLVQLQQVPVEQPQAVPQKVVVPVVQLQQEINAEQQDQVQPLAVQLQQAPVEQLHVKSQTIAAQIQKELKPSEEIEQPKLVEPVQILAIF